MGDVIGFRNGGASEAEPAETLQLIEAFLALGDRHERSRVLTLVQALACNQAAAKRRLPTEARNALEAGGTDSKKTDSLYPNEEGTRTDLALRKEWLE